MGLQTNLPNNQISDINNPDNTSNETRQTSQNPDTPPKQPKHTRNRLLAIGAITLLIAIVLVIVIYNLFRVPNDPLHNDFQKNTELVINSLNNYGDKDNKLTYNSYEIYFKEGKDGSGHDVFYSEYDLIIHDTKNNTSKIIANTFNENVTIYNGKLYYFVSNFTDDSTKFFEYDINTKINTDLKNPHGDIGIYSIVSYNNSVYYSVYTAPTGSSKYGIFAYNINSKQYTKFSEYDIRDLGDSFFPVSDSFIISTNNSILKIDSSKEDTVIYKLPTSTYSLSAIVYPTTTQDIICVNVMSLGAQNGGVFWSDTGKVCLDTSQNYKIVFSSLE